MKRCFFVFLFSVPLFAGANSLFISEMDLKKYVSEQNGLVASEEIKAQSDSAKTGHWLRSFAPQVSLLAGEERFRYVMDDFRTQPYFLAQAEMNLFNGGRDWLKEEINLKTRDQSQAQSKVEWAHQLEQARKFFWEAIYLRDLVVQQEKAIGMIKGNRKEAERRIRAGLATRADLFEFDIKEVDLLQDQKRTRLKLERTLSDLKVVLGVPVTESITLDGSLTHEHDWKKYAHHSESAHAYLLRPIEIEFEKQSIQAKIAGRTWWPKLDAYALWKQNNQREEYDLDSARDREQLALGLKATWSFSSFFEDLAHKQAYALLAKSHERKAEFRAQEIESEIHLELKELNLLDGMVHQAEENVSRAQEFFGLVTKEYRRGVKNSGDMLWATEKLVASEMRKMEVIRDFQMAKAHVLTKLGE